jgi:ABC-type multidrug transport system fused ATPase/permease subunit
MLFCFFSVVFIYLFCSVLQCISIFYYVAVVLCDATVMMMMMSFFVLFLLLVYIVVLLFFSFSSIIIVIIRRRSGRSTRALFEFVQQRERGRVESVSDDWFVLVVDEETNHAT